MAARVARYMPLDFLRGLSIFGMVLSAIQPHGVMPGWMYHVQNPPPTHNLDMSVPGIGWVDLVFPIFIFCMGASIPFAKPSVKGILARFGMLWLFSYLYVFINSVNPWVTLAGFASLFPLYIVIKNPLCIAGRTIPVGTVRAIGVLLVAAVICVNHSMFAEVLSVQRRGIIIFLLAFLYLFGSLIWRYTEQRKKLRWGIWFGILVFTVITQQLGLPTITYANPSIRWWFNLEYIYFLLLLLPSTFVGEYVKERLSVSSLNGMDADTNVCGRWLLAGLSFVLVVWMTFAFYMQLYWWNVALSGVMLVLIFKVAKKFAPEWMPVLRIAAFMVYAGVLLEPYGGGIKKVPCTIQYCFAIGGMAMLLLVVAERVCSRFPGGFVTGVFEGAGKNPLMSYIAFNCLVLPLMECTRLIYLYRMAYPQGMHVAGFARSVAVVLLTMWIVSLFTRKGIFWKA